MKRYLLVFALLFVPVASVGQRADAKKYAIQMLPITNSLMDTINVFNEGNREAAADPAVIKTDRWTFQQIVACRAFRADANKIEAVLPPGACRLVHGTFLKVAAQLRQVASLYMHGVDHRNAREILAAGKHLDAASALERRAVKQMNELAFSVWIDPSKVHPSPIQHEQLSAEQMHRIRSLQQTFQDVDSSSLDKWVEDFKRDQDPEREIRIYEGMAEAYRSYCSGKNLTLQAKQDVFQVVLLRSDAPDNEVLSRLKLKTLSIEDAREILKHYKMAPAPIEVSKTPGGK